MLRELIFYIHRQYPGIPVFYDCKRGDIARTQKQYAHSAFGVLGADGMNFNPYMGKDCMSALVDKENHPGKALVGLCYTTNPDARQIQDIPINSDDFGYNYLWEVIAGMTLGWARELGVVENAGLVMAAAYEYGGSGRIYYLHLSRCREIVSDSMWFLIPGIGKQGGAVEQTVQAAYRGFGSIAINSSSGIIFASAGEDFAEVAAQKARELRDSINQAL